MALNKQTFQTRTLTAIIFVIVMLVGLLINQWTFFALFFIIHWACWTEFEKLFGLINESYGSANKKTKDIGKLIGSGFLLFCLPHVLRVNNFKFYYLGTIIMVASALYFIFRLMKENSGSRAGVLKYSLLGLAYISLTWGAMIHLRGLNLADVPLGYIAALTLVAAIWINDTMQYIVGSLIGKTPFSQISPNKTLEGTLGGSLLCIVVVAVIGYLCKKEFLSLFIYIGMVAAIIGTLGDLLESKIKRMAGVKDSGNFMPGHGGFLDRFDSLILSAPFVWMAIEAVMILFERRTSGL
ncbi:MAG TPA: phosphatidate cytidylyltransferase [Arachidicoccus sp.]